MGKYKKVIYNILKCIKLKRITNEENTNELLISPTESLLINSTDALII